MRRIGVILLLLCGFVAGAAPRELTGAEKDAAMAKIDAKNFTAGTLTADFRQVRNSAMLAEPLTSQGRLYFAGKDKIRWEITSPVRRVSIIDANKSGAKNFDLSGFTSSVSEDGGLYEVRLVPTDKNLARMLRAAIMRCASDGTVRTVTLIDPSGDTTELTFSNIVIDQEIDPKLFENASR